MRNRDTTALLSGFAFAVAVLTLVAFASSAVLAAPKADLWPRWAVHDPDSTASIDHTTWDRLLRRYVARDPAGLNRFDYGGVTDADRARLARYVAALMNVAISRFNRLEQRAYWINLYNALTVGVVLDHYPVSSIRDIDISPGWLAAGPWGKKLVMVEGARMSLDDIEHRILRPVWRDPRIHYAVSCASVGCPNLQRHAFTSDNTDALLDAAARDYVNSPRGVRIEEGDLIVSSIYVWFSEDFGDGDEDIIVHLRRYAEPPLKARLSGRDSVDGHAYDWSLNDRTPDNALN